VSIMFAIGPDRVPPTVTITNPTLGSGQSGTISLQATVTDNVGVVGVQFKIDGVNYGAEQPGPGPSFSASLDTHTLSAGSHSVQVVARDSLGNLTTASVSFSVTNSIPSSGALTFGDYLDGDRYDLPNLTFFGGQDIGSNTGTTNRSLPSNPDPTHYQLQARLNRDVAEGANLDGDGQGQHRLRVSNMHDPGGGGGGFVVYIDYDAGNNVTSGWTNFAGGENLHCERYRYLGSDTTARTINVRADYQYVLRSGYLS
jgi:hypothetical protein